MIVMSDPMNADTIAPPELLSSREMQVLEMATRGLTNGQIAAQLALTSYAVKFRLASIYRKLGVANRTEAAVLYLNRKKG